LQAADVLSDAVLAWPLLAKVGGITSKIYQPEEDNCMDFPLKICMGALRPVPIGA
jgi:hypothetical protein